MNKKIDITPLVSVITPSYNSMPYLTETIESVLAQDYPAIEHIVVDGGSTDGTQQSLQQYSKLVWSSEPDKGQSDALNKGFYRAGGKIIGWLNADDTYQPGAVSKAVQFLVKHPEIDLVYSDLRIIDETSQFIGITKSQPFNLERMLISNLIKQPTVFMRKRVVEHLKGVDESLHYSMDREFWLRAGMAGFKMRYFENQAWANFRLIPGTKSYEQVPQFRAEWIAVLEKKFQSPVFRYISNSDKKKILKQTRSQYYWALAVAAMEQQDRKAFFHHLKDAVKLDMTVLANRGAWLFLINGLLGLKVDRLRKFRKFSA